jgi:Holliday junction resolvasome RuvABC DNA-binding subunit
MSKKPAIDMSSLLASKGEGTPANDAPARPVVTNARIDEKTKTSKDERATSELVNLGFKVPKEFRHRLRMLAAQKDISLVNLLRDAIECYERAGA